MEIMVYSFLIMGKNAGFMSPLLRSLPGGPVALLGLAAANLEFEPSPARRVLLGFRALGV